MVLGELEVRPDVAVLVLHGELDIVTVAEVRTLLDDAGATGRRRLVIDLSDVPFVDVLCLSAILATVDRLRDMGGDAAVVGANKPVRRMCALLGADDALVIQIPDQRSAAV
ncbi:MAG: STAS domain-containing protein [Frankiales bacterium]|nr:STAS domain-containing protein [Frankiales bacterium]